MPDPNSKIGWKTGLAYASPNFGLAIMVGPAMGILHGFIARNYDLTLYAMGMVLIIARLFDAVTDPLVGIASDKTRPRFWGRRSWLTAGMLLSLVAMYFVWVRAESLTPVFFCFWMLLSFLAWTMAEIPYLAWGTEIAEDYNERTKLFSFKAAMGYLGSLIYLVMPLIIMWYQIKVQGVAAEKTTEDYSQQSMEWTFWMLAVLMPLGLVFALSVCPDGAHVKKPERRNLRKTLRVLLRNKAMRVFSGSFVLLGIAGGLQIGMAYLHLSVYLGITGTSTIYFFAFICSLLGVPFWNWFASRFGKHIAFIIGLSITVPFFVALALMDPVDPANSWMGKPMVFWQYLVTICSLNFCQVVYVIMPPAILGDIANADMIETKTDETGTYYSIYTFAYKTVLGVGQGVALLMAGSVFGFDPKASVQTEHAEFGLKLFMGYIPAAFALAGALLMIRYPLTRKKYEEVQAKLREMGLKTS
jgi:glycoside/pentoside/hexuronide:cation symporter, GPH family